MNVLLCNTSIHAVLELLRKKKVQRLERTDVEELVTHPDYQFEFGRYGKRVSPTEFVDYFLNFEKLDLEDIQNYDLRNHHHCWLDLYENLDWFQKKNAEFFEKFDMEMMEEAYQIALAGFPQGYTVCGCKVIFTCGIGQSFGYPYENGIHFDMIQLFRDPDHQNFKYIISHELHHLMFREHFKADCKQLENYFLQCFAGEGLAIKFTNNAQGVLSKKIHLDAPENLGLDEASIQYWNNHFEDTYAEFRKTLLDIQNGTIKTCAEVDRLIAEYWLTLYADGQSKGDIPKWKHPRLYTMGNDLWGTIYDVYGMEELYKTLQHPETFVPKFNHALRCSDQEKYLLPETKAILL